MSVLEQFIRRAPQYTGTFTSITPVIEYVAMQPVLDRGGDWQTATCTVCAYVVQDHAGKLCTLDTSKLDTSRQTCVAVMHRVQSAGLPS